MTQQQLFSAAQTASTSDDYYTPAWIFDRLALTFDLDVCAPPGGVPHIPALAHFDKAADGLAQPWHGRVWMNPPYSRATPWARRFVEHGNGVALVQASKGRWFLELWRHVDGIVMLPGDIEFIGGRIFMPTCLAAIGAENLQALHAFGDIGRVR